MRFKCISACGACRRLTGRVQYLLAVTNLVDFWKELSSQAANFASSRVDSKQTDRQTI